MRDDRFHEAQLSPPLPTGVIDQTHVARRPFPSHPE